MMYTMGESVFADWQRFAEVYPFGEDVEDGRFARLMALNAAAAGGKGRVVEPMEHVLPAYRRASEEAAQPTMTVTQAFKAALGL